MLTEGARWGKGGRSLDDPRRGCHEGFPPEFLNGNTMSPRDHRARKNGGVTRDEEGRGEKPKESGRAQRCTRGGRCAALGKPMKGGHSGGEGGNRVGGCGRPRVTKRTKRKCGDDAKHCG